MEDENPSMEDVESYLKGTVYELKSHWWNDDERPLSFREFVIYLPITILFHGVGFFVVSVLVGVNYSITESFEFGAVIGLALWASAFFLDSDDTILDDVGLSQF